MNDNDNPQGELPITEPKTKLTMNLGIAMEINCAEDDSRLMMFRSDQFQGVLEGPVASAIFSMINQFVVHHHPELILTVVPNEKPTKKELN